MHYKFGMSTWEIQAQLQRLRDHIHQSPGQPTRPAEDDLREELATASISREEPPAIYYLHMAAYFLGLHHELTREKDPEFPS